MLGMADIAALLADRTRARMLEELLGGDPLPAGVLAVRAGVAPSTASEHLARLEAGGLVTIEPSGRRRLARLAGPEVAEALEALGRLTAPERPNGLTKVNRMEALRAARSCYDHLAGRAGVDLTDGLLDLGALSLSDAQLALPPDSEERWSSLGVELEPLMAARRPVVRTCVDWTERRPHLAGGLGAALLDSLLSRRWLERRTGGRALRITPAGRDGLDALGLAIR
jgi:DNA-binding transcriptional ArsR family regulator